MLYEKFRCVELSVVLNFRFSLLHLSPSLIVFTDLGSVSLLPLLPVRDRKFKVGARGETTMYEKIDFKKYIYTK